MSDQNVRVTRWEEIQRDRKRNRKRTRKLKRTKTAHSRRPSPPDLKERLDRALQELKI
jgi:hypothetical protein